MESPTDPPASDQHDNSTMDVERESPPAPASPSSLSAEDRKNSTGDVSDSAGDHAEGDDEATRLAALSATVRDQDDIEKHVGQQADQMILRQANERDEKRLAKTLAQKEKATAELRSVQRRLDGQLTATARVRFEADLKSLKAKEQALQTDCEHIRDRMEQRQVDATVVADNAEQAADQRRPGESQRDFLIRTGKITPFSKFGHPSKPSAKLADVMLDAEENSPDEEPEEGTFGTSDSREPLSYRNLAEPGFAADVVGTASESGSVGDSAAIKRRTRRRRSPVALSPEPSAPEDDFRPSSEEPVSSADSGAESDELSQTGESYNAQPTRGVKRMRNGRVKASESRKDTEDLADVDDGNEALFQARLKKWESSRKAARERADHRAQSDPAAIDQDYTSSQLPEYMMPHPTRPDEELDGGLRVPGDIFPSLFDYQKTGVRWLWELYQQEVGGIIGDEMGLGKTIQMIAFLAGLHHSGKYQKPIIVVCPATLMKQWVNEFHRWWPAFRVSILHTSGSGMIDLRKESRIDDDLEAGHFSETHARSSQGSKRAKHIVDRVLREGHVLVTTYSGLQTYAPLLLPVEWGYAVLDEGHKIRNPNTSVTIFCKELRTPNRVILSGTPMQNNLVELWSLFDFVFPMRLGNLVDFRNQFEIPIKQGGYANASNLQVEAAFHCAEALKDTISPYLLQRWKSDVAADLPAKSEQVLFCKLTKAQRDAYESFIKSDNLSAIMDGRRNPLYGIDILRKICNHPDLQDHQHLSVKKDYNYGDGKLSGKMQVVKSLINLWKDTGHKTLLFAQHRIMLDILEKFMKTIPGVTYQRMDGTTAIKDRQRLVNKFNEEPDLHVFLLTTKVGGLGVNLTGADRVIIYDPDWNPSTDVQARERAWRLGQKRDVMIFRLMTAGTVEEKIYHRQLFKQFLTNKILRDPKQRQTFHLQGLQDLFTLGDANSEQTETGGLFEGSERRIQNASADGNDESFTSIAGVAHHETLKQDTPPPQKEDEKAGTEGESLATSHFMESLLGRSGVHASLSHDSIIGHDSSRPNKITADPAMITREAKRIAAEAAAQLRRAGEVAQTVPVGVPTWTGTVGVAGRPDEGDALRSSSSRGGSRGGRGGASAGPSSRTVLANLAARQAGQSTNSGDSDSASRPPPPRGVDFMTMIRDFLKAHDGRVYTQMLIDHFNPYCTTEQRTANFKEMLRTIAVLDTPAPTSAARARRGAARTAGRGGRGTWTLRKEFGGTA